MDELKSAVTKMPKTWIWWSLYYRQEHVQGWMVSGPYRTDTEAITFAMTLEATEKLLVSTELPM